MRKIKTSSSYMKGCHYENDITNDHWAHSSISDFSLPVPVDSAIAGTSAVEKMYCDFHRQYSSNQGAIIQTILPIES
jgi:hypothetical protein